MSTIDNAQSIATLARTGLHLNPEDRTALVPNGFSLTDLEPFRIYPTRHHGEFSTTNISDFIRYLTVGDQHGVPIEIYIASDTPTARAILNVGGVDDPRWHDWTATLTLVGSAPFQALCALTARAHVLPEQLVEFIDDWGQHCQFTANGEPLDLGVARTRLGDVTVETLRSLRAKTDDFAREKTGMERLTLQPGLPNRLSFCCEPWEGIPARAIPVRIQASDTGTAALKLSLIGWEAERERMLRQFRTSLNELLGDCLIPIYSGSFTRPIGR